MAIRIEGLAKDLDGFSVNRILPNAQKKMVGPFIFLDHMGPAQFSPGNGIDVRPHPHIGLSTLTYMLEGSLLHRDSLGSVQLIKPGDMNWMTAGRGIVHSERETLEVKSRSHALNGIQCWVALPRDQAEIAPDFVHVKREQLPHYMHDGVFMRLIVGSAFDMKSPIKTYSPMFYLDVIAKAERSIPRPNPEQECLLYVIDGEVELAGQTYKSGTTLLLEDETDIISRCNCRCILLGGERWHETPHIEWNFVAFERSRLEQAKADWKAQRFPTIPGDDREFITLG